MYLGEFFVLNASRIREYAHCLVLWDSVRPRTASTHWNVPGKYGPHGELLFFLIQKKPASLPNSEAFNSFIGDGFQVPELKGESEAPDGYQAT